MQKRTANVSYNPNASPFSKEPDAELIGSIKPTIDLTDPQYRKIFVGGLPHNLALADFRGYFVQFGELEDCVILKDKRTNKPRGFGFVTYTLITSVTTVMAMKNKHVI